jgi:hypothetical protein
MTEAEAITSTRSLVPDQTRSNRPAWAFIAESIAGRARWLYEMTTGQSLIANEQPRCGRNAAGLYGVDLSGPPFGSAFRHTVTTGTYVAPVAPWRRPSAGGHRIFVEGSPLTLVMHPHIMPFHVHRGAPMATLTVVGLVRRIGGGTGNVTITVQGPGSTSSQTIAVTGTQDWSAVVTGFTPTPDATQGRAVRVTFSVDDAAEHMAEQLAIWQTRKRDS